jgi:hypothetical protein
MSLKFRTRERDLKAVEVKSRLKGLRPVLLEWATVVSTYSESYKDDACYLYNERTSVGMLAAAAWRSNWIALEEFSTRKASRVDGVDHAHGRCDLKIANLSTSYVIEAKHVWQSIGTRIDDEWLYVKRSRITAKKDAQVVKRNQGTHRLSAVFVSPNFKASDVWGSANRAHAATTIIQTWLAEIDNLPDVHAYAYVFPWRNRLLLRGEKADRIWPGTVLLLKETKRLVK